MQLNISPLINNEVNFLSDLKLNRSLLNDKFNWNSATPVIKFCEPYAKNIPVTVNVFRAINSIKEEITSQDPKKILSRKEKIVKIGRPLMHTAVAVASIAGSLYGNPIGVAITSAHDMGLGIYNLSNAYKENDLTEAVKQSIFLASNEMFWL